jgi:hypothetical protein
MSRPFNNPERLTLRLAANFILTTPDSNDGMGNDTKILRGKLMENSPPAFPSA